MRKLLLLVTFLFIFIARNSDASHIRAGEITAERISSSSFTYEITLVVYTKSSSGIAVDSATIFTSDGWSKTNHFSDTLSLGNDVLRSTYIYTKTFNVGTITISFRDENRVGSVLNMDASINTAFYLETFIVLDPGIGLNTTPTLLVPPIDDGAVGQIYNYNPGAFDADGDSLSYEMSIPMSDVNTLVINYSDPGLVNPGTDEIELDSILGNLEWNVPLVPGIYNIAYRIYEWRNGSIIGYIHRDMQITIVDNNNNKPELILPSDTCVIAGTRLDGLIFATDPDFDILDLEAYSGIIPPATFTDTVVGGGLRAGVFHWTPTCQDIRQNPFQVILKANDAPSKNPSLVDIRTWNITVVGPKVQGITISEISNPVGLRLDWASYNCSNASAINIYRKGCEGNITFDICSGSTPVELGYEFVGSVDANQTSFEDTTVSKAQNYCYVLQVEFPSPEFGKGLISDEVCAIAGSQYPFIKEVSITKTNNTNGEIFISWNAPLDTSSPFVIGDLHLWRSTDSIVSYVDLGTFSTLSTTNNALNTVDSQYYYKVIYQNTIESDVASSVFLTPTGASNQINLDWEADVPWHNGGNQHYVYVRNGTDTTLPLNLLDSVFVLFDSDQHYEHDGLTIDDTLCYYISTVGSYCNGIMDSISINNSQIVCATPRDETPPCPPEFSVSSDCESGIPYTNILSFDPVVSPPLCVDDISEYDVWYAAHEGDSLTLLQSVADSTFSHTKTNSLAGCYYVIAKDITGNLSEPSDTICVDNCPRYVLPNIFTPNGDSDNQLFIPILPTRFVKSVQFKVFNRWGRKIFETDNPLIQWGGLDKNGKAYPDGMYYYVADVEFYRLKPEDELQTFKGWFKMSR